MGPLIRHVVPPGQVPAEVSSSTRCRSLSDASCLLSSQGKTHLRHVNSIDLHTHVYLPRYMAMLRERKDVPFVRRLPGFEGEERLVILPDEQQQIDDASKAVPGASISAGRPIGGEYWDVKDKLSYMDHHGISVSVLSLANPWLDFLPIQEQVSMAKALNQDIQDICAGSQGRFFAFGVVPQVRCRSS